MINEQLTFSIIKVAYEVYNVLGPGFLEKIYERAMLIECGKAGLEASSQQSIPVYYKGNQVGDYLADIVIGKKVLLELKATKGIEPIHQAQLLHYLKATGIKVGLLLNFGSDKLGIKRLVY